MSWRAATMSTTRFRAASRTSTGLSRSPPAGSITYRSFPEIGVGDSWPGLEAPALGVEGAAHHQPGARRFREGEDGVSAGGSGGARPSQFEDQGAATTSTHPSLDKPSAIHSEAIPPSGSSEGSLVWLSKTATTTRFGSRLERSLGDAPPRGKELQPITTARSAAAQTPAANSIQYLGSRPVASCQAALTAEYAP